MAAVVLRAGMHVSVGPGVTLSVLLASPWSRSCQRSCTPSHRTSWTGTNPTGSARRKRRRSGTASTRRPLTKSWKPRRSLCSQPKLSSCQRRYWKSDPRGGNWATFLYLFFPHFSVLWWICRLSFSLTLNFWNVSLACTFIFFFFANIDSAAFTNQSYFNYHKLIENSLTKSYIVKLTVLTSALLYTFLLFSAFLF